MVSHGGAIIRLAGGRVTLLVAPQREVHVIRDEQIEQAVAVVIQPGGAGRPALVVHAGLARDIGESPVAVVVIKNVRAEVGDVEVLETVVVVIPNRHAHAVADVPDAGFFRDVLKPQPAALDEQVAEKAVSGFPSGRRRKQRLLARLELAPLHQINVQVAVVVVVEQRHARAHDLRHEVFARGAIEVVEVEADFCRHITEDRRAQRRSARRGDNASRNARERKAREQHVASR